MKKLCTLFAALMCAFIINAEEGEFAPLNSTKDFSHWSISANVGMSQFDGDVHQNYNQLLSASHVLWAIGLDVEYTISPVWGVVAEFQYVPYMGQTGTYKFRGNSFDPSVQLSINMLNLFSPYRKTWHWAWYMNAGVGMSFYNVSHEPLEGGEKEVKLKDGAGILFPIGTRVEYNINNLFAVGLTAYYRLHNKDNMEGAEYVKGTMNDATWHIGASFRFKFDLDKNKKGGHMRNISQMDYHRLKMGVADVSELQAQIAQLKQSNDTLRERVDSLANIPSCCDEVRELLGKQQEDFDVNNSIYFDFNKWNISTLAKRNIQRVANKLKGNPELDVEIRGYSDFPGSDDANKKVSQNRVDAVKAELVSLGVDEKRITVNPTGSQASPQRADYQSRRCDFIYKKK